MNFEITVKIAMISFELLDRDLFVFVLLPQSITNQRINTVVRRTETPQLHSLAIFDFFRVRISPFNRDITIRVGIHQDIEGAVPAQLREERNRGGNLSEYSSDFGLDLSFGLVGRGSCCSGGGVFLASTGGRL